MQVCKQRVCCQFFIVIEASERLIYALQNNVTELATQKKVFSRRNVLYLIIVTYYETNS